MARILAIDYGTKRVGLAVTDTNKIIATPLTTVATHLIFEYLNNYLENEKVETIVIGDARDLNNLPNPVSHQIELFIKKLVKLYPEIKIKKTDERFSSKMASAVIAQIGLPKMKRRDKTLVDKISASIILQSYLDSNQR